MTNGDLGWTKFLEEEERRREAEAEKEKEKEKSEKQLEESRREVGLPTDRQATAEELWAALRHPAAIRTGLRAPPGPRKPALGQAGMNLVRGAFNVLDIPARFTTGKLQHGAEFMHPSEGPIQRKYREGIEAARGKGFLANLRARTLGQYEAEQEGRKAYPKFVNVVGETVFDPTNIAGVGLGKKVAKPVYKAVTAGPSSEIAGHVASADSVVRGTVKKLTDLITEAKPLREKTELRRSEVRAEKVAEGRKRARETERGRDKASAFMSAQYGELPKARFAPPEGLLDEVEVDGLYDYIWRENALGGPALRAYEPANATLALTKLLSGSVPTRSELNLLENIFGSDLVRAAQTQRGRGRKIWENTVDALNLPRAVVTSMDISAPLRQGLLLAGRPTQFASSFWWMLKALPSERVGKAVDDSLRSHENFDKFKEAGLFIAERGRAAAKTEELFASKLARKIPGVSMSERAYVTFLNKLRFDVTNNIYEKWVRQGMAPEEIAENLPALTRWINTATGRGRLGPLEKASGELSNILFSPKLLSARLLTPVDMLRAPDAVRKEAFRDVGTVLGTAIPLLTALNLSGAARVELDTTSSNFGKIQVGPTRIDVFGGFLPIFRVAARMIASATRQDVKSLSGEKIPPDIMRDLGLFARYKLAPGPSFAVDMVAGKTAIGEPMAATMQSVEANLVNRFAPFALQDLWDAIREQGLVGAGLAAPAFVGLGVQTFETKDDMAQRLSGKNYVDLTPRYKRALDSLYKKQRDDPPRIWEMPER
jgi:hypothetical protein